MTQELEIVLRDANYCIDSRVLAAKPGHEFPLRHFPKLQSSLKLGCKPLEAFLLVEKCPIDRNWNFYPSASLLPPS
jgi:hypothetical protein